ncbi:MAG TPA: Gfo/Idh/MocA family oxidoreductase [Acidobacteriota bacterium]|nr:Gfo/Idh/MocA family oxidoreductase [Acidobacteriota bacterium]
MKKRSMPLSRRQFLKASSAAGVSSISILKSTTAFGTRANSMLQVGLIGSGGRGTSDAKSLVGTGKAKIVAIADYFDFQLKEPAQEFQVSSSKCYSGIDAYKRILEMDEVDAVMLTTPPYFRPEQFEAAVGAGKHVFAEKPIAVDVWGCRKFMEAGKKAAQKNLTVVAGLQTRYAEGRQKIADMIANGAIGEPVVAQSKRLGGDLWRRERLPNFTERDFQVRNWLYYLWASGDFLVEMHVHNLDVINWMSGMLPVSAYGSGGRKVRTDIGDIYDHIAVHYEYPNGFHLSHTGSQISSGYSGQEAQIIGTKGTYDTQQGLILKSKEAISQGEGLRNATDRQMEVFASSSLGEGTYTNNSEYVSTSTFMCVLGRTAAYRNEKVSWKELWDSNERIEMPV